MHLLDKAFGKDPSSLKFWTSTSPSDVTLILALLDELSNVFLLLPFDGNAARHFGRIRAYLPKAGNPIVPYYLQIGAIALTHSLTLVTLQLTFFLS